MITPETKKNLDVLREKLPTLTDDQLLVIVGSIFITKSYAWLVVLDDPRMWTCMSFAYNKVVYKDISDAARKSVCELFDTPFYSHYASNKDEDDPTIFPTEQLNCKIVEIPEQQLKH